MLVGARSRYGGVTNKAANVRRRQSQTSDLYRPYAAHHLVEVDSKLGLR
jgi:hypothetical protein